MKALGAGSFVLSSLFVMESALLASIGGLVGFVAGALLAGWLGRAIFGSSIAIDPVILPIILAIAFGVTFLGSAAAIHRAVKHDPVHALRGEA